MGSMYYITQFIIPPKHLGMINLDIEGTGNEVFVGPIGRLNRFLLRYIHEAAKKNGSTLVENADYPGSDYQSFADYNLENISISIVPKGDGDRLSKFVHDGYKADSLNTPKVLGVMHTVYDRSSLVTPASLKMSYEFADTLLILLNESGK